MGRYAKRFIEDCCLYTASPSGREPDCSVLIFIPFGVPLRCMRPTEPDPYGRYLLTVASFCSEVLRLPRAAWSLCHGAFCAGGALVARSGRRLKRQPDLKQPFAGEAGYDCFAPQCGRRGKLCRRPVADIGVTPSHGTNEPARFPSCFGPVAEPWCQAVLCP